MRSLIAVTVLCASFVSYAQAAKPCEELKEEIAKKIEANGVKTYSLEIVPAGQVKEGEGKVVGSCDGGTKKIVYTRTTATAGKATAASNTVERSKH